jgi:DNA uptake protein ComE-like DNA-binding protein
MLQSILGVKFVDIVSVHTSSSRSGFSQDEVEKLARNFLLSGGSTKPLIVRRINEEEFDVIEGHLEFYAALRAKEIDDNFEMIQAIILDSKNEKAVIEQVDLLKEGVNSSPIIPDNNIIERIKNLEDHLSSDINNLKDQLNNQTELTNLEDILKSQFDALKKEFISEQFIQKIADKIIELLPNKTPSKTPKKKTIEELSKNPIKLNTASKDDLETVPGIGPQKASDIIHRIKTKGKFQNINELAEIKITGISSNTIQKWDKCFDLS